VSHVVMQAAEFPSIELAERCEKELRTLVDAYIQFEATDPDPWGNTRVAPPLVEFGKRHGVEWPHDESSRFLAKGGFEDEAHLLRVDRMVFFWIPGFDLGGETLRGILRGLGATAAVGEGRVHLTIKNDDPETRTHELAEFLTEEEDMADQFTVDAGKPSPHAYFSLTVVGRTSTKHLEFDDSGVQDWAFTAVLNQLSGEDPRLA
jgi:hypothetical protein